MSDQKVAVPMYLNALPEHLSLSLAYDLKQNEAQSACAESTPKGVN